MSPLSTALIVLAAVAVLIFLLIVLPKKLSFLVLNGFAGLLVLFLLNRFAGGTPLFLPINVVTAAGSFLLGIPGAALMVLLQLFF